MTQLSLRGFFGVAVSSALSIGLLCAQGRPTSPGTGSGNTGRPGGGTTTPSPGTTTPSPGTTTPGRGNQFPGNNDPSTQFPQFQRPFFLSGKVLLDDGTPPPESVIIERVCGGSVRPEGYTDSKGRFSIELGRNNQMFADASTSGPGSDNMGMPRGPGGFGATGRGGGITERDLMGCDLRASLPGFRSDIVNLGGRRSLDNPEIGVIVLHRLANVEGFTVSMTSALAPKDARKAYEKGFGQMKKNKFADARLNLEKAVAAYPKYAVAWFELGRALEAEQKVDEARKAYGEALSADAKFVKPYIQLAGIAMRERKWQEVADTTSRLNKLNPYDFPVAYFFNAVANLNLHNLDDAEKSAREAVKLDGRHSIPKANHVLGIILANKQDYNGAAENIRAYLQLVPDAKDSEMVKKQLAEIDQRRVGQAAKTEP